MVSQPSSSPVVTVDDASKPGGRFTSGAAIVAYIAVAKLLFHLLTATRYGIFRDEMYYYACSEHMAWGYVDQPPLVALVIWITRHILGSSVFALRLPAALAGAALVWLAGKLARELGGGRFSQALAALAVFMVPIYMILDHWITMNAFEPLIWMGCLWCVVRAINSGNEKYWFWFGVLAGIGFEAKYSIVFFLGGVLVGVVATPERRILKSKWLWLGALAAFLIFLPNFIWLVRHNFPFIELMHNIRMTSRDVVRGPVAFVLDQGQIMNPILFPLWLAGLAWLFCAQAGKRYRILGWTYVTVLAIFIVLKGKNYYVVPIYPVLFAAGAVAFERVTSRRMAWTRVAYIAVLILCTAVLAPLFAPVLPVQSFIRYQARLGIEPSKSENQNNGALPQYFADEFGWEDMVREVARIYNSLTPDERARTAIFANSYGQAGAIDYFGPKYGLPKAISNHQNYWYWGPRQYTGDIVIVLGSDGSGDRRHFKSVEVAGRADNPYSRVDERYDIFLCRGLLWDFKAVWPKMKKWG
ncbi:MAG TPA: glycosyltransferase family 39 protein [Candidatus Angelobacter sp.]|nr:glycosyltransferase family 39 protein [Candidatus Angelobacter sp.]